MNVSAPSCRFLSLALGAALAVSAPAASAAAEAEGGKPDFSGVWLFNDERSDELQRAIDEAVGPDTTQGDAKREVVRVWIRTWLLGVIEDPESAYLTIEQTPKEFKTGLGDDVSIFYFGRAATSRGPAGGMLRATLEWKGEQLIATKEADKDDGRIVAMYTMLPGGKTIIVAYRLEHKTLRKPLDARMFFDLVEDSE